jgi:hypothetical protein
MEKPDFPKAKNLVISLSSSSGSLLKSGYFSKNYIYSEKRDFSAFPYDKNSIFIFL